MRAVAAGLDFLLIREKPMTQPPEKKRSQPPAPHYPHCSSLTWRWIRKLKQHDPVAGDPKGRACRPGVPDWCFSDGGDGVVNYSLLTKRDLQVGYSVFSQDIENLDPRARLIYQRWLNEHMIESVKTVAHWFELQVNDGR